MKAAMSNTAKAGNLLKSGWAPLLVLLSAWAVAGGAEPGIPDIASRTRDSTVAARVLPLDTVLIRVWTRNPELRMWEEKAQARSAQAEGARAWMAPELGVGGSELPYGKAMKDGAGGEPGMGESPEETPGDPALMLSFRQMIPGPGKRGARARYLASLAGQERAGGAWMKARLTADAKGQYFRMATAMRRLATVGEAEAVMSYMLKVAEARFRNRQADLATVQEAKARLQELGTMRIMETSMEGQAASALALLMADTTASGFSADTTLGLRGYAAQSVDSARVDTRSDLAQVDQSIRSMELNLEWMRRQGRPDFGIQFDHMEMFDMGRRYSIMGMVTLPLAPWSSGMIRSDVKAMTIEIQAMRSEKQARRLMGLRMAREMQLMLKAETDQYRLYAEEVIPTYRASLDAAMSAYQEGSGDLFRVLDIWDSWVMARMKALEHFGNALVLEAEYERETGRF